MKIEHKITATNSNCRFIVEFKIVGVISKEQFKNLMAYSKYNKATRVGSAVFHEKEKAEKFGAYISSINEDRNIYKIEYKKEPTKSKKMSFEDYCEEFLDQDPALMSEEQRKSAYKSYQS